MREREILKPDVEFIKCPSCKDNRLCKATVMKAYKDHGLGFPVTLLNVPMIQMRGQWVSNVNHKELQEKVIGGLVSKKKKNIVVTVCFLRGFFKFHVGR